ncbi:MAG: hypothetical protein NTY71_04395 [Methanoregula sp.]|nr:hypothetical protein [Methanoregula sp.]
MRQHEHKDYPDRITQRMAYNLKEAQNKGLVEKIMDSVTGEAAYCIRCGGPMNTFDREMPLCEKHYQIWVKYKKIKYEEKFCHACGIQKPDISFEKPTCRVCFNRLYK